MNILLIGSGGREHALAWKIKQSNLCNQLFVAPGNAGTALIAQNTIININDFEAIGIFCKKSNITLMVVGPETPLVNGIRDYFENTPSLNHILIVGPGKKGARLEGSKEFAKQFMARNKIPTAQSHTFTRFQVQEALHHLKNHAFPVVLKADGLAAGKGVSICATIAEAETVVREMLEHKKFGQSGETILIEEFLDGIELSLFILTDGKNYALLPEAKDYKRIGENDKGPNTGGMGAVSPVPFADDAFMEKVQQKIISPTIRGLHQEGIPYKGFLFIGLMNVQGEPYVIEYNVRMGDPETQATLPRIEEDLVELLMATAQGQLTDKPLSFTKEWYMTVVMASEGYPNGYTKGKNITGLSPSTNTFIFHAGTQLEHETIKTDGGRVLAVTGSGKTLDEASKNTYTTVSKIQWEGVYCRKDIGKDLKKWTHFKFQP